MWVPVSKLLAYRDRGLIRLTRHPKHDLMIANYSQKCQAERAWDDLTMMCRGLVFDLEGCIHSRPFPKFFNLDEHVALGRPIPDGPFDVYEKLDGSLIVVSLVRGVPLVTSRGSFASRQVMLAKALLDTRYGYDWLEPEKTYCFELIHPTNRIVVNYGDRQELVLLAVFDIPTGYEFPLETVAWPGPSVKRLTIDAASPDELAAHVPASEEGFVVRFQNGLRVKVKGAEYLRLHRLLTGLTPRKIWQHFCAGGLEAVRGLLADTPEEFHQWTMAWVDRFEREVESLEQQVSEVFAAAPKETAKTFALYVQQQPGHLRPALFAKFHGKPYRHILAKAIEPTTEQSMTAFWNWGDE